MSEQPTGRPVTYRCQETARPEARSWQTPFSHTLAASRLLESGMLENARPSASAHHPDGGNPRVIWRSAQQAEPAAKRDRFCARGDPELAVDGLGVALHGVMGNVEGLTDVPQRLRARQQPQHV